MYACTVVGVVVVVVERLHRGQKKEKGKMRTNANGERNKCLYKRFCCREPVIEVTFSL